MIVIESIEAAPVDDTIFEIPDGYKMFEK